MFINDYYINDYWWLLVAIILMAIGGFFLVAIGGYFIVSHWWLFY
jgi:hypothetical protein